MELEEKEWRAGMAAKPKLHNYRRWKKKIELEEYLEERQHDEGRRLLTRCRGGALEIRLETGRWEMVTVNGAEHHLKRHQRLYQCCWREVEDEAHVLLSCPAHAADRRALLEPWAQKAGKLAEEARKIRNGCGDAKAVETELLEWTMNEGQKEAMVFLEKAMRRRRWL